VGVENAGLENAGVNQRDENAEVVYAGGHNVWKMLVSSLDGW